MGRRTKAAIAKWRRKWSAPGAEETRKYYAILFASALVALALLLGEHYLDFPEFFGRLSEALFIAVLLAGLVDPYIKKRLASDVAEGLAWLEAGGDTLPSPFKSAIKSLAKVPRYYEDCSWDLNFFWHDDTQSTLCVEIRAYAQARNIATEDYWPMPNAWAISSVEPFSTEYLTWKFVIPEKAGLNIERTGAELEPYVESFAGRIAVNQGRLIADWEAADSQGRTVSVPPNSIYISDRSVRMYKHPHDSVPLVNATINNQPRITLKGPAVTDLEFEVMSQGTWVEPSQGGSPDTRAWQADHVTFPNEGLIVMWQPK